MIFTSTACVAALVAAHGSVWAATCGGVLETRDGRVVRVYTTEDGLSSNDVRGVSVSDALHARTADADCVLRERFTCTPAAPLAAPAAAAAPMYRGLRETARLGKYVGTSGGLFYEGVRVQRGELCGNHVEALAEFRGGVWAGAFDSGLCVYSDGAFRRAATRFRNVNDLLVVQNRLYVAAAEGLYWTRDGRRFHRDARVRERGVNRLASNGEWLFATTPAALYAIRGDLVRRFWRPGGTLSIQAVALSGRDVWLATEDRGAIRMRRGRFEVFDLAVGLPSSWAVDVAPAPGGGVYVATLRHGFARIADDGVVTPLDGLDAWGLRLARDGDALLAGTQGGAFRISRSAEPIAGLPDPRVHAFLRTAAGLWIGTEGGLSFLAQN